MASWSGSWADEDTEDLGPPPPLPLPQEPSHTATETAAVAAVHQPAVAAAATIKSEELKIFSPPPQFSHQSWNTVVVKSGGGSASPPQTKVRTVRVTPLAKVEFACVTAAAASREKPPTTSRRAEKVHLVESKCDKCHEQRGYLKFTENHVEAQPKSLLNPLPVGTYCLTCVTACSPRCSKPDCTNKTIICLPGARYPFSLFCTSCMSAHRMSHS